ncbi:MAG: hypothetical protein R3A50_10490 [Saprospiraceae bacterium]
MKPISLYFLLLFSLISCSRSKPSVKEAYQKEAPGTSFGLTEKINGITFVAPPRPFTENPMTDITNVGANWIAVVPYAFTRPDVPDVHYSEDGKHWWGERPVGIKESIRLAHKDNLKVMVKPQVWIPRGWTGSLEFPTDSAWTAWENAYERYILRLAGLADTMKAELFCIGTEFNKSLQQRPQFWQQLIPKIKSLYHGPLTYSANWDDWDKVPFWNELDYIGLGSYFPLVDTPMPEVKELQQAWKPICNKLKAFSMEKQKPVLFTEWGYLSVDGCGWQNWELEKILKTCSINQQAQANCMEAMLSTFHHEEWWAGSFLWKWYPEMRGHEGSPERDYTPQGKMAEAVLRKWYK